MRATIVADRLNGALLAASKLDARRGLSPRRSTPIRASGCRAVLIDRNGRRIAADPPKPRRGSSADDTLSPAASRAFEVVSVIDERGGDRFAASRPLTAIGGRAYSPLLLELHLAAVAAGHDRDRRPARLHGCAHARGGRPLRRRRQGASEARSRDQRSPRSRRPGAQSWPLWSLDLGSGPGRIDGRPRCSTSSNSPNDRPWTIAELHARSPRRSAPRGLARAAVERRGDSSTSSSACARPTADGSGFGSARKSSRIGRPARRP